MCYGGAVSEVGDGAGAVEARGPQPGRPAARAASRGQDPGRAGEQPTEQAAERAAGQAAERAGEQAAERPAGRQRIGIRELRQHASVWVDLAERGYTVDITNRGRLVAQLVPAHEPGSPLERLIAAGIIEPAEEAGGVAGLEPYPTPAAGRP